MSSFSRALSENGTPFIILGADAVLAALPASPVQLAHACQSLGFQLAAPATWGDELIAESCLDQLGEYEHPAAIMCSCPLVTERLTRASRMLEPFMLTFVSPPVATARYLRSAFSGQTIHITYAGSCPGADDDSIDARIQPADLLEAFVAHGIVLGTQPNHFDSLVPLDRRRYYSLPGGVPTRDHVERAARRSVVEVAGDDVVLELTQQLIEQSPALLDIAIPLGCACAGAGESAMRGNPRSGLLTLEPPRARQRVLDQSLQVDVSQTLVELCELHMQRATSSEEPAALEVHLAADSAPVESHVDIPIAEDGFAMAPARRRPVISRAPASIPRYASATGEMLPRASLAVMHRALARIAKRRARRQPKVERGRRERAVEIREGLVRTVPRTPRSLAIAGGTELPRPVPPPPARHRPRSIELPK